MLRFIKAAFQQNMAEEFHRYLISLLWMEMIKRYPALQELGLSPASLHWKARLLKTKPLLSWVQEPLIQTGFLKFYPKIIIKAMPLSRMARFILTKK